MAEEKTNELGNHIEMKKVWELLAILVVQPLFGIFPQAVLALMG